MLSQQPQIIQILARVAASFILAYLIAGVLHGLVAVSVIAFRCHSFSQLLNDMGIFILFVGSEAIEAPLSGGFLRDPGNDGAVSYISLYPFIAPVFIIFYFILSRGWTAWLPAAAED
jgi:hypothetical protein